MTHRDKDFWKFALAYILLASSLFLIIAAIVDWNFFGAKLQLGGAASGLFLGTLFLASLNHLSSLKRKSVSEEKDTSPKP